MNLSVLGLGIVSRIGDTHRIEHLLTQSTINPNQFSSNPTLLSDISEDLNISPQLLRRMNHFAKLSLLSAYYAISDSGIDISGKSIGIIQGSVYGPITSGIQAFDDLIDFGDNQLSPTNFSGSVFNTSATYLSLAFGIQGCTLVHTSGQDTLYNSLLSAKLWLESKNLDYVIVGIGDEYTTLFDEYQGKSQSADVMPSSEGWTTFVLSKDANAKYGHINFALIDKLPEVANQKYIYSMWHEQGYQDEFLNHVRNHQACFPALLRGSYPSASAFDLALALICCKNERFPVYNGLNRNYLILNLNQTENIHCYCPLEGHHWVEFKIFYD